MPGYVFDDDDNESSIYPDRYKRLRDLMVHNYILCLDTLRDLCYANFQQGSCLQPLTTPMTKSSCCCSYGVLGQTPGWGSQCSKCPSPDTLEFKILCPQGSGMTYNGDGLYFPHF